MESGILMIVRDRIQEELQKKRTSFRKLRENVGVKAGSMERYEIICAHAEHSGHNARVVLPQVISFSEKLLKECVMRQCLKSGALRMSLASK